MEVLTMAISIIKQSEGLTGKDIYMMTRSPALEKLSSITDTAIKISAYVLYEDEKISKEGETKTVNILGIRTDTGKLYATNSQTFIDEFLYICDLFGLEMPIRVVGGVSRSGRHYITCTIE